MDEYRIDCKIYDKKNQRIAYVGIGPDKFPVAQIWDWIENSTYSFYTQDALGTRAEVQTGVSIDNRKYITTHPDRSIENNLDEIMECQ